MAVMELGTYAALCVLAAGYISLSYNEWVP